MDLNLSSKRRFNIIYIVGLVGIGGYFIWGTYTGNEEIIAKTDRYLLPWSIAHVLLLSVMGFFARVPRTLIIGSKIQTAGYLYTLIGFIVAVLRLNVLQESFSINTIFAPLGAALITSLLGWFLGGLITEEDDAYTARNIKSESERVAAELSSFAKSVGSIHKEYTKVITEASIQFTKIQSTTSKLNASLEPLKEALDEFGRHGKTGDFTKDMIRLKANMSEAADAAKYTAEYLKDTTDMIDRLKDLIKLVADER